MSSIEDYDIGTYPTCIACKKTELMKADSKWVIYNSDNYHELSLCETCKEVPIICLVCDVVGKTVKSSDLANWFYDYIFYTDRSEHYFNKPAHLCPKCRVESGKGDYKCDRCFKKGEEGIGKWNENQGHLHCYHCDMDLCYDCHDLVHYNK